MALMSENNAILLKMAWRSTCDACFFLVGDIHLIRPTTSELRSNKICVNSVRQLYRNHHR